MCAHQGVVSSAMLLHPLMVSALSNASAAREIAIEVPLPRVTADQDQAHSQANAQANA